MSRVVLYIATSLDGYIADADGGVAWLDGYADGLADFDAFMSSISAVVMGRATYDFSVNNPPWRLGSMPTAVLTHHQIDSPPEGVFAHQGPIPELVSRLSEQSTGDIWLMGGGQTIRVFLDADAIDEYRIFVVPELLGRGTPLFLERTGQRRTLKPTFTQTLPSGLLETRYTRAS